MSAIYNGSDYRGDFSTFKYLLSLKEEKLKPSQEQVDSLVMHCNNLEAYMYLVSNRDGIMPTQEAVDKTLILSSFGWYKSIEKVQHLTSRREGVMPTQEAVDKTLVTGARFNNDTTIVEYLISNRDGIIPTQTAIDDALFEASRSNNQLMVHYLLSRVEELLRPSQSSINRTLIELTRRGASLPFIALLLGNNTPENLTRTVNALHALTAYFQGTNDNPATTQPIGLAYEIHNYSNTPITDSTSSNKIKLNEAVTQLIENRIKEITLEAIESVLIIINKYICETIDDPSEQGLYKQAMNHGWIESTPKTLRLVLTFLKNYYPENIPLWIHGYLGE